MRRDYRATLQTSEVNVMDTSQAERLNLELDQILQKRFRGFEALWQGSATDLQQHLQKLGISYEEWQQLMIIIEKHKADPLVSKLEDLLTYLIKTSNLPPSKLISELSKAPLLFMYKIFNKGLFGTVEDDLVIVVSDLTKLHEHLKGDFDTLTDMLTIVAEKKVTAEQLKSILKLQDELKTNVWDLDQLQKEKQMFHQNSDSQTKTDDLQDALAAAGMTSEELEEFMTSKRVKNEDQLLVAVLDKLEKDFSGFQQYTKMCLTDFGKYLVKNGLKFDDFRFVEQLNCYIFHGQEFEPQFERVCSFLEKKPAAVVLALRQAKNPADALMVFVYQRCLNTDQVVLKHLELQFKREALLQEVDEKDLIIELISKNRTLQTYKRVKNLQWSLQSEVDDQNALEFVFNYLKEMNSDIFNNLSTEQMLKELTAADKTLYQSIIDGEPIQNALLNSALQAANFDDSNLQAFIQQKNVKSEEELEDKLLDEMKKRYAGFEELSNCGSALSFHAFLQKNQLSFENFRFMKQNESDLLSLENLDGLVKISQAQSRDEFLLKLSRKSNPVQFLEVLCYRNATGHNKPTMYQLQGILDKMVPESDLQQFKVTQRQLVVLCTRHADSIEQLLETIKLRAVLELETWDLTQLNEELTKVYAENVTIFDMYFDSKEDAVAKVFDRCQTFRQIVTDITNELVGNPVAESLKENYTIQLNELLPGEQLPRQLALAATTFGSLDEFERVAETSRRISTENEIAASPHNITKMVMTIGAQRCIDEIYKLILTKFCVDDPEALCTKWFFVVADVFGVEFRCDNNFAMRMVEMCGEDQNLEKTVEETFKKKVVLLIPGFDVDNVETARRRFSEFLEDHSEQLGRLGLEQLTLDSLMGFVKEKNCMLLDILENGYWNDAGFTSADEFDGFRDQFDEFITKELFNDQELKALLQVDLSLQAARRLGFDFVQRINKVLNQQLLEIVSGLDSVVVSYYTSQVLQKVLTVTQLQQLPMRTKLKFVKQFDKELVEQIEYVQETAAVLADQSAVKITNLIQCLIEQLEFQALPTLTKLQTVVLLYQQNVTDYRSERPKDLQLFKINLEQLNKSLNIQLKPENFGLFLLQIKQIHSELSDKYGRMALRQLIPIAVRAVKEEAEVKIPDWVAGFAEQERRVSVIGEHKIEHIVGVARQLIASLKQ